MKSPSCLLLLLLLCCWGSFAQKKTGVSGSVVDSLSGEGLEYVTVIGADQRGRQVGAAISRSGGEFMLVLPREGKYVLYFSFLGYTTASVEVSYEGKPQEVNVKLSKSVIQIEQINVVVKPLIRREADRIVYDVSGDPDASKMKMMEFMKKIPNLYMNPADGKLSYENSNVPTILIDGRDEPLINASRQYPMEFIKADYMDKIEVILPGSAEYHNERTIINIKLDRPLPNGIAGELSPSGKTSGNFGAEADFVTKTGPIGVGLNYTARFSRAPQLRTELERHNLSPENYGSSMTSYSQTRRESDDHSLRLNLFRPFLDQKLKLNVSAGTSFLRTATYGSSGYEKFDGSGALTESSVSNSNNKGSSPMRLNGGASLNYNPNRNTSYLLKYSFTDSRQEQLWLTSTQSTNDEESRRRSQNDTGTRQHIVNFKYSYRNTTKRKTRLMLYANLNYVDRQYHNTSEYWNYDFLLNDYVAQQALYRGLEYRQQVFNTQLAISDSFLKDMLSYSVRLSGEGVINKGIYLSSENSRLDYREFNLLPSVKLNARIRKKISLTAGYNTRVMRPSVERLNPFVDNTDPVNIVTGNPALRGEYAHRLTTSVSKDFSKKWLSSISASYGVEFVGNAITRLTTVNADNVSVTSYANLARSRKQSASLSIMPGPIVNFLVLYCHFNYTLTDYFYPNKNSSRVEGWGLGVQGMILLKGSLFGNITYSLAPAFSSSQTLRNTYYSTLDISASRYFEKIRLGGSVGFYDILHSNRSVRETIGNDTFIQHADIQRIGRSFQLSIYWRFGRFRNADKPHSVSGDVYDMSVPDFF